MLKQAFLIFALFPLAFSLTGDECPLSNQKCLSQACVNAGGDLSSNNKCVKDAEFDEQEYNYNLDVCKRMDDFCIQNDGLVHNMSCFGPVLILLALVLFSCADDTP